MPDINLSPYTAEYEAIQQRRKLAELLSQQGSEPIQMPTQAGVRISPLQGLAKMFEVYSGQKGIEKAQQEQKGLAERIRSQGQNEVSQFLEAIQGKAAVPEMEKAGPAPENAMRDGGYIQPAQEAVAPDMRKALSVALSAQANPTVQGAGGALLANMMKPPESAFAKLNPKDYTPDSVRTFMASGGKDFSLLKPLEKLMTTDTGQVIQGRNPYTFEPVGVPVAKQVGVDTTAQLTQARELSDRAFNQLSVNQKAQLANEAKRIGISAQQLYFDTGMQAGGNAPVGAGAPTVTPNVAPNAAPQGSYTRFGTTQGNAPIVQPTNVPPAQQGNVSLSPRAMQDVEKARLLEEFKGMNESQSNAALFGGAMNQAQSVIQGIEKRGTTKNAIGPSVLQAVVKLVPFGVGEQSANIIESISRNDPTSLFGPNEDQQRLGQAQIAFATAWLRKTSGASFGGSEIANTIKEYFPLIGESDAVVKQKAEARERAIEGLKIATGPQGKTYIDKYGASKNTSDPLGLRPRGGQ
jgi:hypothetical protein